MKSRPLISVVVPVYNVENYLAECLQSIVNQSYVELEIILVNDGSTDNSPDICRKFTENDSRVKLYNIANSGLSAARNRGVFHSTGDYIAFIDSDDWIDLDMFEQMLVYMLNENVDVVECNYVDEYPQTSVVRRINDCKTIVNNTFLLEQYSKHNFFNGVVTRLYKKQFLNQIQFKQGRYYEDSYFMLELAMLKPKYCTIPEAYYHYRRREGSILMSAVSTKKAKDAVYLYQFQKKCINSISDMHLKQNLTDKINTVAISNYCGIAVSNCVANRPAYLKIFGSYLHVSFHKVLNNSYLPAMVKIYYFLSKMGLLETIVKTKSALKV